LPVSFVSGPDYLPACTTGHSMIATKARQTSPKLRQNAVLSSDVASVGPRTGGGGAHFRDAPTRVSGAMPGITTILNAWAHQQALLVTDSAASISGGMARTPQPEAMMARGVRVTGSGAGAPADISQASAQTSVFWLSSGIQVVFSDIEPLTGEVFL
jgi:hypothetical protein